LVFAGRSSGLSGFLLTPSHPDYFETVAGVCQKPFYGLTATGIAPGLHGIPFSSSAGNRKKKPANIGDKCKSFFGYSEIFIHGNFPGC
jgi:hypothetical protein